MKTMMNELRSKKIEYRTARKNAICEVCFKPFKRWKNILFHKGQYKCKRCYNKDSGRVWSAIYDELLTKKVQISLTLTQKQYNLYKEKLKKLKLPATIYFRELLLNDIGENRKIPL